jgi:hypothetical protein
MRIEAVKDRPLDRGLDRDLGEASRDECARPGERPPPVAPRNGGDAERRDTHGSERRGR